MDNCMEYKHNTQKTKPVNLVVGNRVLKKRALAIHSLGENAQILTMNMSGNKHKQPML
jgi:hypothetical protein